MITQEHADDRTPEDLPPAVDAGYQYCPQEDTTTLQLCSTPTNAPAGYPGTSVSVAGPWAPTLARMWPPPPGSMPGWGVYQPPPTAAPENQQQQWQQGPPPPMPPAGGPKRRAFISGCNYQGTSAKLNGCVNDARCMEHLLKSKFGWDQSCILMFTDDHPDPLRRPTKQNMFMAFQWLMTDLQPGDSLLFHYSGHGGQSRDQGGEEMDGMNETLLPLDFERAGQIVDDDLNRMLINPLPHGVKLHAIIDACHSGSVMDLPYQATVKNGIATWEAGYAGQTRGWKGTGGGFAVQFSASKDSQVAADTAQLSGGVPTGAATFCFIKAVEDRGVEHLTYGDLLLAMWQTLQSSGLGERPGGGGLPPMVGGGGLDSLLMSMLGGAMGGGQFKGQAPVMSANYAFDMSYKFSL